MKFKYNKQKEIEIFNKIKDDIQQPSRTMWKEEIERGDPALYASSIIPVVRDLWEDVSEAFLRNLGEFYNRELEDPDLTVYLCRLPKFPYAFETGWFAAPLFSPPSERVRVIEHELCHYFQPLELKRAIKEAIPVILNDHEAFRMYSYDRGHNDKEEQEWRKIIWELYEDGKTIWDLKIS